MDPSQRWRCGGREPLRAVRIDGPGLIGQLPQIHGRDPCPGLVTRPMGSIEPKRFESHRLWIPEEDRVDVLHDVAGNLKKASLVL
jgi:hypothetical protein